MSCGVVAVIPEPRDQQGHRKRRGSRGGRPVPYNPALYKGHNVVERTFCLLKQWRRLATRYDELAGNYRGAVILAAVLTWLRTQETRTRAQAPSGRPGSHFSLPPGGLRALA